MVCTGEERLNVKLDGSDLLKSLEKGSKEAFDLFYEKYVSFVLHIASQVLGDRIEAEDICHDIFLEVFQKPYEYNAKKGTVEAWLAVKTKHRSIDRLRKKQPILIHKLEQLDTPAAVRTEMHVLRELEKEVLLEAMKYIPKMQQKVIYGVYFEDKTQKELAKSLNRPLGTVKSMVRYGLQNMRKQKHLNHWMESSGSEQR